MRRNSDPWLRFYVRTLNNPKVQQLPPSEFKGWVNLLCLAKEFDGALPPVEDIAFRLRLSKRKAETLLKSLQFKGLLDGDTMHDWDEMQYPSDSSTERVKQHRERKRNVSGNVPTVSSNVPVTVQSRVDKSETVTETETEVPATKTKSRSRVATADNQFQKVWLRYPNRKKKLAAGKAWEQLKPDSKLIATIHAALNWQCEQIEWRKDGGQYVPLLASYLNGRRWEDERCPEDYKTEAELKEGAQKKRDDDAAHAEIKKMHDKFHANSNT